jgi:hypothetical protein
MLCFMLWAFHYVEGLEIGAHSDTKERKQKVSSMQLRHASPGSELQKKGSEEPSYLPERPLAADLNACRFCPC